MERIRAERRKAKANKNKYGGTGSDGSGGGFGGSGSRYGGFGSQDVGRYTTGSSDRYSSGNTYGQNRRSDFDSSGEFIFGIAADHPFTEPSVLRDTPQMFIGLPNLEGSPSMTNMMPGMMTTGFQPVAVRLLHPGRSTQKPALRPLVLRLPLRLLLKKSRNRSFKISSTLATMKIHFRS